MTTELFIARAARHVRSTSVITLVGFGLLALPTALFADDGKTDSTPSNGNLRPDLAYQAAISRPINYRVDFSAVVTPPYGAKVLRVWLPIPPSDNVQQIRESELTSFPMVVEPRIETEPLYGNRFAYFEFHEPKGAQIIRHRFAATVADAKWDLELDKTELPERWPETFQPYLREQSLGQSADFQKVLAGIKSNQDVPASQLLGAMDWIDKNLTYDHVTASLRADAEHAFTERRGHCSDYHGLCATMGRSFGVSTRVTYGIQLFPKNSPSHCKMEAFLPPVGWVSFDLSETQKLIKKIGDEPSLSATEKSRLVAAVRNRLTSGYRENSWLLLTRGTDYDLAPPAARPVPVVRTIYAEADGEALPEPDPANTQQREFGWMTVHHYEADQPVPRPFVDWNTLESRETMQSDQSRNQ